MRLQRLAAFIFVIEAAAVFASAQYLSFNFSSCNNESLSDEVALRAILWQQNASLANITFLADGRWIIKNEQKQWRLGALNVITFSNDESDKRTLSLRVNNDRLQRIEGVDLTGARLELQLFGGCVQFDASVTTLDEQTATTAGHGFQCVGDHQTPCGT